MGGAKFDMARTAVEHAVRLLKPDDHLGVTCYDEEMRHGAGPTPATKEAKTLALQRLAGVDAPLGSTDLCGGWLRGATWPATPRPTRPAWPRCCCSPTASARLRR